MNARHKWKLIGVALILVSRLSCAESYHTGEAGKGPAALRFATAQAAARDGDYESAMQGYARLMLDEPDNVDYIFGYAQALYWSGDLAHSIQFLEQARRLAPGYEDIWQLEYRARLGRTGDETNRDLETFRDQALRRFPGAEWLRQDPLAKEPAFSWHVRARRDNLDNGSPDWQVLDAFLERRLSSRSHLSLSANRTDRFGASDTNGGVGIATTLGKSWFGSLTGTFSSSPEFLPRDTVKLGLGRKFQHGWVASARWEERDYDQQNVVLTGLTAERYLDAYRLAYTISNSRLDSETAWVHGFAVDRYAPSGFQIGLAAFRGEEIDNVALDELAKTEVWSIVLKGRIPLSEYLGLGWQLGVHEQGDLYRRNFIEVSVFGGL